MRAYYFQIIPNITNMKGGAVLCSNICTCGGFCISKTSRENKLKTYFSWSETKPFATFIGLKNYRSVVIM